MPKSKPQQVNLSGQLGENFFTKLVEISNSLGVNAEDLLGIMVLESGFDPSTGRKGGATGIIQFMPKSLKGAGWKGTPAEFAQITGSEQLDYVKKFVQQNMNALNNGKPFTSLAQFYISNLFPIALKLPGIKNKDPNAAFLELEPKGVIGKNGVNYSKKYYDIGVKFDETTVDFESKAFRSNSGLSSDKKAITYGDIEKKMNNIKSNPIYLKAVEELRKAKEQPVVDPGHGPEPSPELISGHGPEPEFPEAEVKKPTVPQKPAASPQPTSSVSSNELDKKIKDLESLLKDINVKKVDYDALLKQIDTKTGLSGDELEKILSSEISSQTQSPQILDLQELLRQASYNKKMYNSYLPTHSFIIKLNNKDYNSAIECGTILVNALDEELMANSFLYTNNDDVEVQCNIQGPKYLCARAIYEISKTIVASFNKVIKKVGSHQINITLTANKKSSYKEVSIEDLDNNHQIFLQKIFKDTYDF